MTKRRCNLLVVAPMLLGCLSGATDAAPRQARTAATVAVMPAQPPPYAKYMPPAETIALPGEQQVLSDFVGGIARGQDPASVLDTADKALARLPAPTKLRGAVQFVRAGSLGALNRDLDALDAIEESVRLLPDYSGPLIKASSISAYLGRPGEATDYLMRAIDLDPETVRTLDDYEVDNLTRRLNAVRDQGRVRALSDRLLEIGWLGSRLGSRSGMAVEAIKRHVDDGDLAGARALVPKLLVPGHSYSLLMQSRYRDLWPDIETWAGPRLERQWTIYLAEARARWSADKTAQNSLDYLSALLAARHYRTAVRELLPSFDHPDKVRDYELIFGVNSLAETLARLGRWNDAEALYARAQAVWPLGEQANALNIAANRARFLLFAGRPADALKLMDQVLVESRKWGPQVGSDATAAMHHYRACMLHQLGRDAEASVSMTVAVAGETPPAVAGLHLCMGDPQSAKKALIAGLQNEEFRGGIIGFVQVPNDDPLPSDYSKEMRVRSDALRNDPELLAAIAGYGRIVPWAENAGAPAE